MKAEKQPSESSAKCPSCNVPLPLDAPLGMCPRCLLMGGKTEYGSDMPRISESSRDLGSFGDYELIEEVARGGMGVVFLARQKSLQREVALKMILSGQFASEREVCRFVAEAEAAAHLRHPHIVAVHEFGDIDGHHYYTMDFIRGCNLDQRLEQGAISSRQAVSYLIKVARALHYAHQRGVIHRDLKPQNILLDEHDEPRITDFGLAKRMDLTSDLTLTGTIFGSPSYMAPEQAEGRHEGVGPQTDVYALGAILYRLVSGKPPFDASSPLDALKKVVESEPKPLRTLNPEISVDLDTICLKCLEKDPDRRYASAEELADELQRWILDKPIKARRIAPRERIQKWVRRNPVVSAMSLLVAAVGVLGFVAVWWQLQQTRSALKKAEQLVVAEATARAVEMKPYLVLPHEGAVASATFDLDGVRILSASHDGSARLWDATSGETIQQYNGHQGVVGGAEFSPDESQVLTFSFDTQFRYPHLSPTGKNLVTSRIPRFSDRSVRVWDLVSGNEVANLKHPAEVVDASFSPDGKRIVTAAWDHHARIWDVATSSEIDILKRHKGALLSAKYSPKGNYLVVASSGYDYQLTISPGGGGGTTSSVDESSIASIWDASSGSLKRSIPNRSRDHVLFGGNRSSRSRAVFSSDGKHVVIAGADPANLMIWNMEHDRLKRVLDGHEAEIIGARFSSDGTKVVSYSADSTARVWDLKSGKQLALMSGHKSTVLWAEFSLDGKWIATASSDHTARVWDANSGVGISVFKGHTDKVYQARFSPDGSRVVTSSEDGFACVWDAASMTQLSKVLKGHESHVISIDFSPDSQHVVTSSKDGSARLWEIDQEEIKAVFKGYGDINDAQIRNHALGDVLEVKFSPDGGFLVTSSEDSRALLRRVDRSNQPIAEDVLLAPFTPARLWDVKKGVLSQEFEGMETGAIASRFSPNGRKMCAIPNGEISEAIRTKSFFGRGWSSRNRSWNGPISIPVWNVKTGQILFSLEDLNGVVKDVVFSPDGQVIATADLGPVRLWDAATGSLVKVLHKSEKAKSIQFTPNTQSLLMHDVNGLGLWEMKSGERIRTFESPSIPFIQATLNKRGDQVIAWTTEGTVCVFEITTGLRKFNTETSSGQLRKALLTPSSRLVVTIGWENVARVWGVESGKLVQICEGHEGSILDAEISPDGQWLGTISEDYTARLWPLKGIRTSIPEGNTNP